MQDRKLLRSGGKSLMLLVLMVGLVGAPAFAAGLARNSVRSKHIKDGHVRTADIGDGQVRTADIGDGQVTGGKLGAFVSRSNEVSVPAGQARHVSASCLAGERPVGVNTTWGLTITGGGTEGPVVITRNAVANNLATAESATTDTGASAIGRNNSSSAFTFTVTARCMS